MSEIRVDPPATDEYDAYYQGYIDRVQEGQVFQALEDGLENTIEVASKLTDEQARHRYAPGKWSIKEVLGHLMDTERVFVYRALCISRNEQQSLPGFDEKVYVSAADFDDRSIESLLDEYRAVRQATIAFFRGLGGEDWVKRGTANDATISVRALAHIIAGHEMHHHQIIRERYLATN